MPLVGSTSKDALRENTQREIAAGKPAKQAYAIAWSVRRRAAKKKKGMVEDR